MNEIKTTLEEYIIKDIKTNYFEDKLNYILIGGKLLRSIITYSICKNENYSCIVEYIHNASLIIDDMPCMDNDKIRRNKESVHIKYGENTALLLSSSLLLLAYKHVNICILDLNKDIMNIFNNEINNEINNLINGQYMDLNSNELKKLPNRLKKTKILELMKLKTGSLFALSILLGYIGKYKKIVFNEIEKIKNIGYSIGICFQIIDDLKDYNEENENKEINIKTYYTKNELIDLFSENLDNFRNIAIDYKIYNQILDNFYNYLLNEFKIVIN